MMTGRLRLQCAVMTRGCAAWLVIPVPPGITPEALDALDREVPEGRYVADMLAANGWSRDHGRWVCPAHDRR